MDGLPVQRATVKTLARCHMRLYDADSIDNKGPQTDQVHLQSTANLQDSEKKALKHPNSSQGIPS